MSKRSLKEDQSFFRDFFDILKMSKFGQEFRLNISSRRFGRELSTLKTSTGF